MRTKRLLSHKNTSHFDTFYFGVCYYPEHWHETDMQNDARLMADMGINVVRMTDFAWSVIEPKEKQYQFDIFDQAIKRLTQHDIKVILCTPTAAPPRWLTQQYPQINRVNIDGEPMQHGSRQHACHANPIFTDYSNMITRVMAEHFATNTNIIGWQIDNEFNCHFSECHCDSCQHAFVTFLRNLYQNDINALNDAWGTVFWAQNYDCFEQIHTPKHDKPSHANPAHRLDYHRYLSHNVTYFQEQQIQILRSVNPNWWITHNGVFSNIDYRGKFTQDLDVLGYDMYPMFFKLSSTRRLNQAYSLDRTRACSGNFIILEHQSGAGGQPSYMLDNPVPGEMRAMTYSSIARGADSLLYFRWRSCRYGAEQYWCGLIDHDNIPRRRYNEAVQVGQELKRIGQHILGTHVRVDCAIADMDYDNLSLSHVSPWGMPNLAQTSASIHHWLNRRHYAVGLIHPEDDLSDVDLYVIPHWQLFRQSWLKALEDYVRDGGTLVVGCRTSTHNEQYHVHSQTPPGPLTELLGITVTEYGIQSNIDERPMKIQMENNAILIDHWYEQLCVSDDVQTLGTWQGSHLDGQPAITCRKIGKGQAIYVGTYLTENLINALLPQVLTFAQVHPLYSGLPECVEVVERHNENNTLHFIINRSPQTVAIPQMTHHNYLLTSQDHPTSPTEMSPWEVRLIRIH